MDLPTLGWGVLKWAYQHLPSPSDERQPFVLTDEQAQHVLDWYAFDPATHDFIYRRDIIERAKGWGKSPLAALLALAELSGPVVYDTWNSGTDPQGKPWPNPWVQIAAVSEDQTDNTYGAIYELLTANDGRAAKELGIDDGRTRLYLKGRPGRLEPVTASAGSREGQRLTFAILDETHLWTPRNGGVKLANTIRRNVGKMGGRSVETTNAPVLGEKSVAERSGNEAGRFTGILHYAIRPKDEPQPDWTDEQLLSALNDAYGDAHWIDRNRILREVRDPSTSWDDALRFYFNIRSAGSGHAVDPRRWDELAKPRDVPADEPIGLGFDGSISRDATVLRGCTADGYSFLIRAWVPPKGVLDWTIPRQEVHDTVAESFARYRVGRMFCDPPRWYSEIEQWREQYGDDVVVAFDTNQARRFAPAVDRWLTAIREGTHTHDGDPLTADHLRGTMLRKVRDGDTEDDGRTKYVLVKGEDRRRIDASVADVLAFEAAMTMPPDLGPTPSIYESGGLTVIGA